MSDTQLVRIERDEELAVVYIDRQEKLNALNPEVVDAIGEAFDSLRNDDSVRAVILTGAGEKAFVAGADIGELAKMDPVAGVRISRQGQGVFRSIEQFPKPVIAAVNGYALGGGCELALACHIRIAADSGRFGLPEVGLGIIPGYGGTIRLARLIGLGRAIELTLTGRQVKAEEAHSIGLVSQVHPRDELLEKTKEFARTITKNGPVALRLALESIYDGVDASTQEALLHESALFGILASTDDMKEGMGAFLEKRKPKFEGK